jgi:serine/threonine-protein kinase
VALKVVRPSSLSSKDADRLRRFEQEARVAAALNHPNIVSIFESAPMTGCLSSSAKLLEGYTLRERLSAGRCPSGKAPAFERIVNH